MAVKKKSTGINYPNMISVNTGVSVGVFIVVLGSAWMGGGRLAVMQATSIRNEEKITDIRQDYISKEDLGRVEKKLDDLIKELKEKEKE